MDTDDILAALAFNASTLRGEAWALLAGAVGDAWHCDAAGIYSDARDPDGSTVVWAKLATLAAGARVVSREFF